MTSHRWMPGPPEGTGSVSFDVDHGATLISFSKLALASMTTRTGAVSDSGETAARAEPSLPWKPWITPRMPSDQISRRSGLGPAPELGSRRLSHTPLGVSALTDSTKSSM